MVTTIKGEDLVQSVADALQFISHYHPADYINHLACAYEREESPAAKDAIGQILVNSRMAVLGRRPICQDTGTAVAFLKIGMGVRFDTQCSLLDLVNEGVRRAYTHARGGGGGSPARRSGRSSAAGDRQGRALPG